MRWHNYAAIFPIETLMSTEKNIKTANIKTFNMRIVELWKETWPLAKIGPVVQGMRLIKQKCNPCKYKRNLIGFKFKINWV